MSAKRKAASDLGHVFVLTLEEVDHGNRFEANTKIMGVYDSKQAAAAAAGNADTPYGTMDEAILELGDDHEDNRGDPPDDGLLVQAGSPESGEGDHTRVWIKKFPILGMPDTTKKGKQ